MNKELQIIHVFDDDKFIDPAISLFEHVFPNQSTYYVISYSKDLSFRHVKSKNIKPIYLDEEKKYLCLARIINQSDSKVLFIHALNRKKQKLVSFLDDKITKVWFIWGYDLYNEWKPFENRLYGKRTRSFINKNKSFRERFINALMYRLGLYRIHKKSRRTYLSNFYKAVQEIDICVPVIPTEVDLVKELNENIKKASFNYVCIENVLREKIGLNVLSEENILVGNSGNPSNNHLEVIEKLSKLNLQERKVIVPLSYGGSEEYVKLVLSKGNEMLKGNFYPIVDFIPLENYNTLVLSCGHVIFNHIRQQAVTNIVLMGYAGAKLYLNTKGVAYKYYNSMGLKVFRVKDVNDLNLGQVLTKEQFNNNQKILEQIYSLENVRIKIKELFKIVFEVSKNKQ